MVEIHSAICEINNFQFSAPITLGQIQIKSNHHTSNSRERMEVNGEALQLHVVYKSHIFTASHVRYLSLNCQLIPITITEVTYK